MAVSKLRSRLNEKRNSAQVESKGYAAEAALAQLQKGVEREKHQQSEGPTAKTYIQEHLLHQTGRQARQRCGSGGAKVTYAISEY